MDSWQNLTVTTLNVSHSGQQSLSHGSLLSWLSSMDSQIFSVILSHLLSWTTLWRVLFALLALGNLKNLPFIWHLRIVNAFRFCLYSQRPKVELGPDQIFQPIITESHAPLMEIDFNLHSKHG
jgi:hypothetical protein